MRAIPILLIATLLVPVSTLAQQRVPPDKDRSVSGGAGDSPAAAVPRESPPPPSPPPAPPPPEPAPRTSAPTAAAEPRASSAPDDGGTPQAQRRQRVPPEARRDQPRTESARGSAIPRLRLWLPDRRAATRREASQRGGLRRRVLRRTGRRLRRRVPVARTGGRQLSDRDRRARLCAARLRRAGIPRAKDDVSRRPA